MPVFADPPLHASRRPWNLDFVWQWCLRFAKGAARYLRSVVGPNLPPEKRAELVEVFEANLIHGA